MTGATAPRPDVAIVGAGIVGAACAYVLSGAGLRVLVLERGAPGGGATGAAMGHVVAMDDSAPQLALTAYGRQCWAELAPELPPSCADRASGTTWVATTSEELALAEKRAARYAAHGVAAHVLDPRALAALEPNLRPGLLGALHVPDDRVVYPPGATAWLLAESVRRGAAVRSACAVTALGARWVHCGDEVLAAGVVINAAGPHAAELTPGLPIIPRKGHLVVTDRYPGLCHTQVVEMGYLGSAHTLTPESVACNLHPRPNGQVIVGSTRELVGWDQTINRPLVARMVTRAIEYLPALARCHALRTWVGFRPATPDKLPLIGWWDGVFVAAGHEGLGVATALATAHLVRALIVGGAAPIDPAPYAPARAMRPVHPHGATAA